MHRDRDFPNIGSTKQSNTHTHTQLAIQVQQERIQVVRSNKVAWKRLTESNSTPAMDFGFEEIRKLRYTQTKNRTKHTSRIVI